MTQRVRTTATREPREEVVSLKRKLDLELSSSRSQPCKKREIENKERLANINNSYILKKQAAVSIVEKFKEPYEAIQKIIEDLKKEVGQLSRAKLNELRMTNLRC